MHLLVILVQWTLKRLLVILPFLTSMWFTLRSRKMRVSWRELITIKQEMRVSNLYGNYRRWIRVLMKMKLKSHSFLMELILQMIVMMINGSLRTRRKSLNFKSMNPFLTNLMSNDSKISKVCIVSVKSKVYSLWFTMKSTKMIMMESINRKWTQST